ncbi:MAG: TetR/AcrR family transcriptional regulator [Deltaproteobacteria bacterium]|nr:TetR/AcrR family transcriptional regulator [Deltaproteobacteria bacterium]
MATTRTRRTPAPHADATRARIVGAAVKAFAEKGFEAASTREIARVAGVEQGLLTYHFPSKDELWRAATDRIFGVLRKAVAGRVASLDDADPSERSREAIREYVRTMAGNPEFFRFIVDQGHRYDARTRWLVDTHIKSAFAIMKELGLLRAARREEDLPHALFSLLGAASFIFGVQGNCRRLTGLDPRKREAIEAHADFVANLMIPPG